MPSEINCRILCKMGIVEEESDEASYWIETFVESEKFRKELVDDLLREADKATAMVVASIKTAKSRS